MATPYFAEPIDSSRLVTRLLQSSLDDLRAQAMSSSVSLTGLYVRSPATSPANSQECVNLIFHPESNYTESLSPQKITWDSRLVTSFASFAALPSTSPYATTPSYPEAVEQRVNWKYQETSGPPPGYTLESDEEEIIVYKKDVRDRLQLLCSLAAEVEQQRPTVPPPPAPSPTSIDKQESSRTSENSNSISGSNSTVTFAPIEPVRRASPIRTVRRTHRVMDLKEATHNERGSAEPAAPAPESGNAPSFSGGDEDAPAPLVKRQNSVYKFIKKKLWFGNAHRKTASESESDSSVDDISVKTAAPPSPSPQIEKIKPSSASMFNVSPRQSPPARPPSVKSLRPSLTSPTPPRKNVLVKRRGTLTSKIPARRGADAETTPRRPESARATESDKFVRRRSASFSGFANVAQPDAWELPLDLDSELVREAMAVVSRQSPGEWEYKRQSVESKRGASSARYVGQRKGAQ